MRFAASDFAGAAIRNDSGVWREHTGLMVAELEADDGTGVEIRQELIASLNRLFNFDVVRQQQGLEGGEVVRLQSPPHPNLLDEDEVRLGVEVFGDRALLREDRHDARGEQREEENWLHGWEFNLKGLDCILHSGGGI